MPSQSGWAIVYSQLDESVEEVLVKVGQLLSRAHLFEVVRGNNQKVTQSMKRVEELEHKRNLWRIFMQLLVEHFSAYIWKTTNGWNYPFINENNS